MLSNPITFALFEVSAGFVGVNQLAALGSGVPFLDLDAGVSQPLLKIGFCWRAFGHSTFSWLLAYAHRFGPSTMVGRVFGIRNHCAQQRTAFPVSRATTC
jgi:hypothetical protein